MCMAQCRTAFIGWSSLARCHFCRPLKLKQVTGLQRMLVTLTSLGWEEVSVKSQRPGMGLTTFRVKADAIDSSATCLLT